MDNIILKSKDIDRIEIEGFMMKPESITIYYKNEEMFKYKATMHSNKFGIVPKIEAVDSKRNISMGQRFD